ncbi:hypothetical protein SAMN04515672_3597 [Natronorubrum texcoconense]|uniref:Uncharacterized protein n=1 Tax=Natronorubrum texcoconense TaxID=1095776 RepID=A0A1G9DSA3_9EURY|nr:hypothetical protein SAMN04515672_3597 [Natronorubrum texcoconense]
MALYAMVSSPTTTFETVVIGAVWDYNADALNDFQTELKVAVSGITHPCVR